MYLAGNEFKNDIVNHITPLLKDLRDKNKKDANNICVSFSLNANDNRRIESIESAMKEICDANPDIRGGVNVFDKLYGELVKGVILYLYLANDTYAFSFSELDRLYAHYPEFYAEIFDAVYDNNKFFEALSDSISAVKEKRVPFKLIQAKLVDGICNDSVFDAMDKVEQEGLKYQALEYPLIENSLSHNVDYYVYFFIYETKCKEIDRMRAVLERRIVARLV